LKPTLGFQSKQSNATFLKNPGSMPGFPAPGNFPCCGANSVKGSKPLILNSQKFAATDNLRHRGANPLQVVGQGSFRCGLIADHPKWVTNCRT
jgi:hypothetical protein